MTTEAPFYDAAPAYRVIPAQEHSPNAYVAGGFACTACDMQFSIPDTHQPGSPACIRNLRISRDRARKALAAIAAEATKVSQQIGVPG